MLVLGSSILLQVIKKIFGIIDKRGDQKKHGGGALEKNSKINKRRGRLFNTQEYIYSVFICEVVLFS